MATIYHNRKIWRGLQRQDNTPGETPQYKDDSEILNIKKCYRVVLS